jgi:SAM-dependent methyltransferase
MPPQILQSLNHRICCPLCGSDVYIVCDSVSVDDLVKLWVQRVGKIIGDELADCREVELRHCTRCDLKYFHPFKQASAAFYETLFKTSAQYYQDQKQEFDIAKKYVLPFHTVLEIGAGRGAFAKQIDCKDYIGLEYSRAAAELAHENGVCVLNESLELHSNRNREKYDVVCAFQVLEHVANVASFIQHSLRCLRESGFLIYSVPCEDSYVSRLPNNVLNLPPHHLTRWTDRALKGLAGQCQIEMIEMRHDALAKRSVFDFTLCYIIERYEDIFGIKGKLVDVSFLGKVRNEIAYRIARLAGTKIVDKAGHPRGHSVTVVYRKQAQDTRAWAGAH